MKHTKTLFAAALALAACAQATFADEPGRHPAYIHAMSDLRTAQWMVEHRRPEDGQVSQDETIVRDELTAAIEELRHAAWLDQKPLDWQPPADATPAGPGRLHAALDLMRRAREEVGHEEDDPRAREFQMRGLHHIDAAIDGARHSMGDAHAAHEYEHRE